MSMSTYVVGIIPPDSRWKAMKAAWDACQAAKVQVPREVEVFFDGETPDPKGVVLDQKKLGAAVSEYRDDSREGLEVDVRKLPKDVAVIRFVNSY